MKTFALVSTGALCFWMTSCDQTKTETVLSPEKSEKASPSTKPVQTQAPESIATPAPPEPKEQVKTLISVEDWKKKAANATEMEEINTMKTLVKTGVEQPEAAIDFLVNAPHSPRRLATLRAVTAEWVKKDKDAVIAKADSLADEALRDVMRMSVVHNTSLEDIPTTKAWINGWTDASDQTKSVALGILDRKENPETPHVCGPGCVEHAE